MAKKTKKNNVEVVGTTVQKPWGSYKVLFESDRCVVKHLIIKEGHRISLQKHLFKYEHWTVLPNPNGYMSDYSIQIGDKIYIGAYATAPLRIDANTVHRAEAFKEDLHIIEVSTTFSNESVKEDDIIRYHDDYNRK